MGEFEIGREVNEAYLLNSLTLSLSLAHTYSHSSVEGTGNATEGQLRGTLDKGRKWRGRGPLVAVAGGGTWQ